MFFSSGKQYICPYCSNRYAFFKTRLDGVTICGQCGEEANIKRAFGPIKLISLLACIGIISPLIYSFTSIIKFDNPKVRKNIAYIDIHANKNLLIRFTGK